MKAGLVSAIVIAALLAGSMLWWSSRPSDDRASDSRARVEPLPSRSSLDLAEAEAGSEKSTRSELPSAGTDARQLGDTPSAPSVVTPVAGIVSIHESRQETEEAGSQTFELKYAWMSGEDRREALEALRVLLNGGAGSGQPALSVERSLEIKREIEWLTQHESP